MKNIFKIFTLSIFVIFGSNARNTPGFITPEGLVGWWSFDKSPNDGSLSNNHGYVHGAKLTKDRFGRDSCAYSFDGISNYISMQRTDIPKNMGNGMTISLWFNATPDSVLTNRHFIFSKYNGMGMQMEISNININGKTRGILRGNLRENTSLNPNVDVSDSSRLDDGNWHQAVFRWEPKKLSLYVDGKLVSTAISDKTQFDASGEVLRIGCLESSWFNPARYFFKGKIDDIAIWNRALSPVEIYGLVNQGEIITLNPENATGSKGDTVSFNTGISNYSDSITYQWQSKVCDLDWQNIKANNDTYSGYNRSRLSVKSLKVGNHLQQFRVIANYKQISDTSKIAILSLNDTCINTKIVIDTNYVTCSTIDTLIIYTNTNLIENPTLESIIARAYPNPTKSELIVSFPSIEKLAGCSLHISNNLGQILYNKQIDKDKLVVNLTEIGSSGLYHLIIVNDKGKTLTTKKIILK
jgi:hypothetical protein